MKKRFLFTLIVITCLGWFNGFAQPGFSCAEGIQISSLPFTTTDHTANYGNTIDGMPGISCGVTNQYNFLAGNDVFYRYTPTTSGVITVVLNSQAYGKGIFVFDGCNNIGVACETGSASTGDAPNAISSINVIAGHEYTFLISCDSSQQTYDYTLTIDHLNCAFPTNLNVISTEQYSAQLGWTNPGNGQDFEIVIQPLNSGIPSGAGIAVNGTLYLATNLSANTTYQYRVRTKCSDGTFSLWSAQRTFTTDLANNYCPASQQCNYTFNLLDSFGDGWNGNTMTIWQNGTALGTFTINEGNGSLQPMIVPLCHDEPFELFWNLGGSFPSEVGVSIQNPDGQTIYYNPPGTAERFSQLYNSTSQCNGVLLMAFIDENANGIRDAYEMPFTFGNFAYQLNNSGPLMILGSQNGNYPIVDANSFNTYDFSYQIDPAFAPYFSGGNISYNDIGIPQASTQVLNFPMVLTTPYSDVGITINGSGNLIPGTVAPHNYRNSIYYENFGSVAVSGTISFTFNSALTITQYPIGAVVMPGGFTYSFGNLPAGEKRSLFVSFDVAPMPILNIGDLITNTATITMATDLDLSNNTYVLNQHATNSYDPNDKTEAHGGQIVYEDFTASDYLYYTIRFQNTGNADAIRVKLEDLLDDKLDENTISTIASSHLYSSQRSGQQQSWIFDNIMLKPESEDEVASQGFVSFKIKPKPGYAVGDIIPNTADIYFDSNPAIVTEVCLTEFVSTLKTTDFSNQNILLHPNPATTKITLHSTLELMQSIAIYDLTGKRVKQFNGAFEQLVIDVDDLQQGMYLIEIETQKGYTATKKLIVQ